MILLPAGQRPSVPADGHKPFRLTTRSGGRHELSAALVVLL